MKTTVSVTAKHWTRNFQYRTRQRLVRYWNFSFIISELMEVNPDYSLAECVNLEIMYMKKALQKVKTDNRLPKLQLWDDHLAK